MIALQVMSHAVQALFFGLAVLFALLASVQHRFPTKVSLLPVAVALFAFVFFYNQVALS